MLHHVHACTALQIPKVSRLDLVVDEDSARFMFRQLVMGLQHLHDNHVAHRWAAAAVLLRWGWGGPDPLLLFLMAEVLACLLAPYPAPPPTCIACPAHAAVASLWLQGYQA